MMNTDDVSTCKDWNLLMFYVNKIESQGYEFVVFKDEVSKDSGEFILSTKSKDKLVAVREAIYKFLTNDMHRL